MSDEFEKWWSQYIPVIGTVPKARKAVAEEAWKAAIESTKSSSHDVEEYYKPKFGCDFPHSGQVIGESFCWMDSDWSRCSCALELRRRRLNKEDCPHWKEIKED